MDYEYTMTDINGETATVSGIDDGDALVMFPDFETGIKRPVWFKSETAAYRFLYLQGFRE